MDPAAEAAQRAERQSCWWESGYSWPWDNDYAEAAAREALAPLRRKHQRRQRPNGTWECTSCRDAYGGKADWPTGTDRLIYPSEEL